MEYDIPEDIESRTSVLLATGQYATREETVRVAVAALECLRSESAAIQEGIDDLDAGRVKPLREFDRDFRALKD